MSEILEKSPQRASPRFDPEAFIRNAATLVITTCQDRGQHLPRETAELIVERVLNAQYAELERCGALPSFKVE